MISVQDYLHSAAIYSISILIGSFAGIFLFKNTSFFKALFLGIAFTEISIVFFYSVILTEGKTIFTLLLVPAILLIPFRKEKTAPVFNKKIRGSRPFKIFLTILFGLLFEQFFVNVHYYSVFTQTTLPGLSDDYIYYANLANLLNAYHTEAYLMLYTSKDFFTGIEPFHYFDIWLTAFFIKISGLNAVCAYSTIVLPMLQFTVLLGIGAIIESWTKTEIGFWRFIKWSVLFLLLSGISFWVPAFFTSRFRFDVYSNSFVLTLLKLNVIYMGFLFSFLSFAKNRDSRVYFLTASFMFLIISYTVLLPVFFLAYFLLALSEWFSNIVNRRTIAKSLVIFILFIFMYLGFAQIYGSHLRIDNSLLSFILPELKKSMFYITSLHILLLIFLFTLFWFGIYFLSALLILPVFRENRMYRENLIFLTCCLLSGAVSWCLFHVSANSVQLWVNVYLPVMNILTFIIVFLLLEKSKQGLSKYFAFLLIILSLAENVYNFHTAPPNDAVYKKFYSSLKASLSSHSPSSGIRASVLINAKSQNSFFARSVNVDHPLMELEAYFPYFFYDNISVLEINFAHTPDEEPILFNSAFYQFVQKEKQENNFKNISLSQVNFIKKYQIPYLIVGKNAPENTLLKKHYSTVLISPDSDKFIVLDKTLFNK